MTLFTVGSQSELEAVILSPVPMTGFTTGGRSLENEIDMALCTGDNTVAPCEWKIGFIMIEEDPAEGLILLFLTAVLGIDYRR
jgi:hypothetical protein